MREILFRGKNPVSSEWAYGSLVLEKNVFDERLILAIISDADGNETLVNPETIGQYTGLKDKNGTKIFEGSIVRIYYPFDDPNDCVVSWSKEGARWDFGGCDAYFCTPSKNCEIIGNIHDNPELLEGSL